MPVTLGHPGAGRAGAPAATPLRKRPECRSIIETLASHIDASVTPDGLDCNVRGRASVTAGGAKNFDLGDWPEWRRKPVLTCKGTDVVAATARRRTLSQERAPVKTTPIVPLRLVARCVAASVALSLAACTTLATEPAQTVVTPAAAAAPKLARKPGEMVTVSIYEFRSAVGEISPRGSTDMFKTALVNSGQFRVVERSRLNEGVLREKQLNAGGLSAGKGAREPLTPARYIFEGAITEANASETQRAGTVRLAGAELGASGNKDVLAIDVRMVDAHSAEIVGVVTVRKAIGSQTKNLSGLGNLLGTVLASSGKSTAYVPDVQYQQQRKESLDGALRAAIDQAVIELAQRFQQ